MRESGVTRKIILGIGISLLLIELIVIVLGINNKININLFGGKAEVKSEAFVLNTDGESQTGDNVPGEIVVGGTGSQDGHAYRDGNYINGYCVDKGIDLYGTYVSHKYLQNQGSAYNMNNAKSGCDGQMRWLFDNILRVNITTAGRTTDSRYVKTEETNFFRQNLKNILNKQGKAANNLDSLSDLQIYNVQQYVFWQFVNQTPKGGVLKSVTPSWINNVNDGRADLFNALVAEANEHAGYSTDGRQSVTIEKADGYGMVQDGNDVLIGPMNINNPNGKMYQFNCSEFYIGANGARNAAHPGNNLKLYKEDRTTEITNDSYINYSGKIYAKITNFGLAGLNQEYKCEGTISAITYNTIATYWKNEANSVQPVITFGREPNNQSLDATVTYYKKGEVDLALKKMIDKVDDISVETGKGFNVDRHSSWTINTKPLSNGENNAKYLMNKTPVEVRKGQVIDYKICIYNEGQVAAKALEINDYLPVGLELQKVFYKGDTELTTDTNNANYYTYDEESGIIIVRLGGAELIEAFGGETDIHSDYITVKCKVKNDAVGILTNVAEIRKYQTESGEITIDRDSTSDNWNSPTGTTRTEADKASDKWRNYTNAQMDWLDGEWHEFLAQDTSVEGKQGDDDDFEKVKVLDEYNLKIKKVDGSGNGIDDIKFDITKKTLEKGGMWPTYKQEKFENVVTTNSEITYSDSIEYNNEQKLFLEDDEWPYAVYVIDEVKTSDNNWFQLEKPITLAIIVKSGKVTGYNFNYGGNSFGGVKTASETFKCLLMNGLELEAKVNLSGNDITVQIENLSVIEGKYGLRFRKISSGNQEPLQGVTFGATSTLINSTTGEETDPVPVALNATDANGYTNVITTPIAADSADYVDKYVVNEINLGTNTGYSKIDSDITIRAYKKQENGAYKINYWAVTYGATIRLITPGKSDEMYIVSNGVKYKLEFIASEIDGEPVLTVVVPNAPDNNVPIQIRKVSAEDGTTVITGTSFKITKGSNILYEDIDTTGSIKLTDNLEADITNVEYKVEEIQAADGYDNVLHNKYIKLAVTLSEGIPTAVTSKVYNADGTENTELSGTVSASIIDVNVEGVNVKTVDLKIEDPETTKIIDLALKKIITEVKSVSDDESKEVKAENGFDAKYDRLTQASDKFNVDLTPLKAGKNDAIYNLNKTPIEVLEYSTIKYQIRIYNEGTEEPTTASKITDYIPNGLVVRNVYYRNTATPLVADTDYKYDEDKNVLEITALKDKPLIPVYDGNNTISYDYVTVECDVTHSAKGILTNIAQISEYKTGDGVIPQDRDSYANDWKNPVDRNSDNNETVDRDSNYWVDYAGYRKNVIQEGIFKNYPGQQDDDDFEKIKVVNLDLVLKKIITKVNNNSVDTLNEKYHRFQGGNINVNTAYMNRISDITTADYYLNKTPIVVGINDTVTYQIRIYNEGNIDATASSITDYIPNGMTFNSASYNGVDLTEGTDYTIDNTTNILTIKAMKNHFIQKYIGSLYNNVAPSYDYVTVTCTVNGSVRGILTNVAEISKYQISTGEVVIDRDSQTVGKYGEWVEPTGSNKNTLDGKSGSAWANYMSQVIQNGEFANYPGQQDDDDFEKVQVATNYSLQVQKVSALGDKSGLSNVDIKINDTNYTTNATGETGVVGPVEILDATTMDTYKIEEIATNDENYVKLLSPISLGIVKSVTPDGCVYISGYKIRFIGDNLEDTHTVRLTDTTYYTLDENHNFVHVKIKFDRTSSYGQIKIKLIIENTIKDASYDLKIRKVDQDGHNIDGVKFNIDGQNEIVTDSGIATIGTLKINSYNVDTESSYTISEIETLSKYYKLKDSLKIVINKGHNEEGTKYVVKNMKLVCGDKTSEQGTDITLENIPLENESKKVNITAKLEGSVITITVPNMEKEFDLSLRKFITKVNGENISYSRQPIVNVDALKTGEATTAIYEHTKQPLQVMPSDIVEYTIRVYNEGPRDGFAELVMDDVPEGLEMIAPVTEGSTSGTTNAAYRWKMYKQSNEGTPALAYNGQTYVLTEDASEADLVVSDHLSSLQSQYNLMKAFDPATMNQLDYRDIKIEFKVKETAAPETVITNYAQITADANENAADIEDRDSTPNQWIDNEDDQDIEKIIVSKQPNYDLALQKFITGVTTGDETKDVTDREPKFSKDSSVTTGDGYKYTPKFEDMSALEVSTNDIVTYTLRVYNEGEADAYAAEITDDIPEGVEFVPYTEGDGTVNDTYRWVMYKVVTDEEIAALPAGVEVKELNGKQVDGTTKFEKCIITTDVKEADYVVSDYLSKEQGENRKGAYDRVNPSLIYAFEPTTEESLKTGPNYKDVKVQFKVTFKASTKDESEKEIINSAQITKETDRINKDITDRDSTPNEWIKTDDDQDKEKIKVKYFDLALVKWVSEAVVVEDGVEKVTPGNKFEDLENKYDHRLIYAMYPDTIGDYTDLEPVVKVDIPKSKLASTVVKFKYQIRVYNEGQIDGYAKEITDYIPKGMKFVQEDNPLWEDAGEGKVITTQLEDKLLTAGGESQTIEIVYTWVNSEDNLGLIVNTAEISKDYNESNSPDVDSTPNNATANEDDIDDAAVLISVRTGETFDKTYIILGISVVALISTGIILIKKFVL